jgi:KAP family P-loop domain
MATPELPPLRRKTSECDVPAIHFEGDLFGRAKLAERLTGFLHRLPDGAVIAIDSQWGEGKTWFGRRWNANLKDDGFQTAYIDCFQRDHLDDPFTMIAGEFLTLADTSKPAIQTKLLTAGKKLGVALLPVAAKFAINTVGHWALGNATLSDTLSEGLESLDASAADALEKAVAKHIADYQDSNASVDAFKAALTEMTAQNGKPIVVFMDELDRCRPDFAVRTIERVKHFFDVPGVIFVLLINRNQLVAAVEGLYGSKVDANAYLAKFIPISLTLPKQTSVERHGDDDNRRHCKSELTRLGFPNTNFNDGFAGMVGILATLFNLSLRDVERAVMLYSFAQPLNSLSSASAWPIALKLHKPDLYRSLCAHDPDAHEEAAALAAKLKNAAPDADWLLSFFEAMHQCGASGFKSALPENAKETLMSQGHWSNAKQFMTVLFGRIDLMVE